MSAVPVNKPIIIARPKAKPELRVEQGTRPSILSLLLAKAVLFAMLTLGIYFASSLAGQVMVEKARRDGLRAVERNQAASKEVAFLRDQVQAITDSSAIASWAELNHMIPPEGLVAQTDAPPVAKGKDGNAKAVQ
ncbi:MAG TPA: hypothetical protein VMI31_06065 [Fimbriimonadaceae bacterium]|nr:hypothetical protein [Fimbriimonadaceae bacterium]